jgi:hypothetical protein
MRSGVWNDGSFYRADLLKPVTRETGKNNLDLPVVVHEIVWNKGDSLGEERRIILKYILKIKHVGCALD